MRINQVDYRWYYRKIIKCWCVSVFPSFLFVVPLGKLDVNESGWDFHRISSCLLLSWFLNIEIQRKGTRTFPIIQCLRKLRELSYYFTWKIKHVWWWREKCENSHWKSVFPFLSVRFLASPTHSVNVGITWKIYIQRHKKEDQTTNARNTFWMENLEFLSPSRRSVISCFLFSSKR